MWIPVFGFILGIFFGSFLNVCVDRLPRGKSIVKPPSHCDGCGKRLGILELIPIVSYLWLKGRCRDCGAKIPLRVPLLELTTGLLFAFISLNRGLNIEFVVLVFYTCLFLVLAVIDLEHGLLLNVITYPAILISLALSPFWTSLGFSRMLPWEGTMLNNFFSSVAGGGLFFAFFLLIVLLYKGGMGWGDVKMAVIIGLVTGFPLVLVAMVISFLSGGLIAVILLLTRLRGRKEGIPYGPFLALGTLVTLLWGNNLLTWYLALSGF